MTSPATHAEGLRVLWLLASRGVSATWGGTAVGIAPPDPAADGAVEALEAVLRPDADGRSYLQRARERHASLLGEVKTAKPTDVTEHQWRRAIEGLEFFLLSGWADEADRLGWSKDELFRVPALWSQIAPTGVALLVGDNEVVSVSSSEIRIRTSSGSSLAFYRKPLIDYALIFETRLKLVRGNFAGDSDEPRLRAVEHAVNAYRQNNGCDLETAKAAVLAAIDGAAR